MPASGEPSPGRALRIAALGSPHRMQIHPTESTTRCRHLGVPKNDRHPASNFQPQARSIWAASVRLTASHPASGSRFKFPLSLRSYIVRAFGRCMRCCEESSDASWSAGGRTRRRPSSMRIRPPQGDRWRVVSGRAAFARRLWGTAIRTRCSTGFFFCVSRPHMMHAARACARIDSIPR